MVAKRFEDMRDAHAIDPSRTITFTSGWANKKDALEDSKAHFRPFDTKLYMNGWFDNHRAGGPETWREDFYNHRLTILCTPIITPKYICVEKKLQFLHLLVSKK